MLFGNGVKNIQAAAYNGARTVLDFSNFFLKVSKRNDFMKTSFFPKSNAIILRISALLYNII